MKRVVLLLSFAIFSAAAVCFGVPYYQRSREKARRHAAYADMFTHSQPLVLDDVTKAILNGADRVETFRLQGGDEDENSATVAILHGPHPLFLEDHPVLAIGQPQGRVLAASLREALSQVDANGVYAQCFEPGMGFRAWKGKSHVDVCVCFTCGGVEITTKDAKHAVVFHCMTNFGKSRPAFLTLSQQAFPQDQQLAETKPEAG